MFTSFFISIPSGLVTEFLLSQKCGYSSLCPNKAGFGFESPFGLWRELTRAEVWAGTLCSLLGGPAPAGPSQGLCHVGLEQDPGPGSRRIPGTEQGGEGGKEAAG